MKKLLFAFLILLFSSACTGNGGVAVESITLPEVQSISYKDIVECSVKEDEPGYSLCKVKDPKSGLGLTVKIQTSDIPTTEPKGE